MKLDDYIKNNPFDRASWPEKLIANVVQPGDTPRVHGYDLQGDIAKYYRWSETLFLSLTGEFPVETRVPAIEVALILLSSVSVSEAPGHAAVLAGFCGATNSAALSIVTITLAEQARTFIAKYNALPKDDASVKLDEDAGIMRLKERLQECQCQDLVLESRLGVLGAALSVLEQCGLSTSSQLEAAWVIARLPVTLAEVWHQPAGRFNEYPTQLPNFKYHHPRQEEG